MKITGLRTAQVEVPFERPIRTAIHHIAGVNCVLVRTFLEKGKDHGLRIKRLHCLDNAAPILLGQLAGRVSLPAQFRIDTHAGSLRRPAPRL